MTAANVSMVFSSREAVVVVVEGALVSPLVTSLVSSSIVTVRLARGVVRLSHDDGMPGRVGCMSSVESEMGGVVGWCDND